VFSILSVPSTIQRFRRAAACRAATVVAAASQTRHRAHGGRESARLDPSALAATSDARADGGAVHTRTEGRAVWRAVAAQPRRVIQARSTIAAVSRACICHNSIPSVSQ
jgi:hypothetical protein